MGFEESRGRLKAYCYSSEVQALSSDIKKRKHEIKHSDGELRDDLQQELDALNEQYTQQKEAEIAEAYQKIVSGKHPISLEVVNAKGKEAYSVNDLPTLLVSKFIALELKHQYQLNPANRDDIIEELRVLLDNPMPKILIRTDIHHFYETIQQDSLMNHIEQDDYLTAVSIKYLRKFLYEFNRLSQNEHLTGVPRGLSFSPNLAEIYLREFDRKVRNIQGVFFYKRYVDDIVLLANPELTTVGKCWKELQDISTHIGLSLHEDGEKLIMLQLPAQEGGVVKFNYLGYQFRCADGHTDLLLTSGKCERYRKTIDSIFKAYAKVANYRTVDEHGKKRTDGIVQLMHRIEALTGNGHLDSRRNFVKTGLYYSNKQLTDLSQLEELDSYLATLLNDPEKFCPPRQLFNYSASNDYDSNVQKIRGKILVKYSFMQGFMERRMYRWKDYVVVLKQLQNLYYKTL